MDENPRQGGSGWTVGKVIGVVVGLMGMVGFGLCSLCGMVYFGSSQDGSIVFLILLGVVLTALSLWLVVAMFRKARAERERDQP